jgi:hypothetical protein
MKNRLFLLALGLAFSVSAAFGQDYAFRVMASKGTNEVKSGDSWQAVKPGSSLKTGDELKLAENSYVGLIHVSGKPVEVRDAGTHKVADLAKNIQPGQSVLNKYTDFILSSNAEGKKNKLSATGAVHRGTGASDISVFLPENQFADVFNNTVVINWESPKAGGPYVVVMKNMFDDELAKYETPETSLSVNLASPELANESAILVEVSSKADPKTKSEQKLIKKMNTAQADKVKKEIADLGVDLNAESAIGKFYLAGFYEEKKLYIDAITAFEQAIKLESAYKEPYEDFLLRNKLKVAPQQ